MLSALAALALAAAPTPASTPTGAAHYVADQYPAKAMSLDVKKVCTKGYVDPGKLVISLMNQLDLEDDLSQFKARADLLPQFDGRRCPAAMAIGAAQDEYCTGAIVVQRLLLNVYPGFQPASGPAGEAARSIRAGLDVADPAVDRPAVAADAVRFLASTAADRFVRCDLDPAAAVEEAQARRRDTPVVRRDSPRAEVAEAGFSVGRALKAVQFRQYAGNLMYRDGGDGFDGGDPTFASGLDLYNTDAGVSLGYNHDISDEAAKKDDGYTRTRKWAVEGAVGLPLCGLFAPAVDHTRLSGKPCNSGRFVDAAKKRPTYTFDVIPYAAVNWGTTRTRDLRAGGAEDRTPDNRTVQFGAVAYLATDDGPEDCRVKAIFGRYLANCATIYSARVYHLRNELDGSKLNAGELRLTPLVKTTTPGFRALDFCLNTLCGDPDQWLRLGLLGDVRYARGHFEDRGDQPRQQAFNQDYERLGGRIGAMGTLKLLPETPVKFWASYSNFHAFKGFDRDLGEVQAQASVDFTPVSIALQWRNGRREDTAKRDTSVALTLGFKPK